MSYGLVLTYNGEQSSSQVFSLIPTMTLKELQPQLLALSLEEKAQAIQILAASLGNGLIGIEKTPGVMGGRCLYSADSDSGLAVG